MNTRYDDRQSPRNKASNRRKFVLQCFLLTSPKTIRFQYGDRLTRIYTAVSLQQDEFRTNRFYFLPITIPASCIYAVKLCSCGDQAVTHTHTHQKITITLRLRAWVNDIQQYLLSLLSFQFVSSSHSEITNNRLAIHMQTKHL